MFAQQDMITIGGIPAHPLVVHAVVVLLPLAALGGLVIALRATWRRRLGVAVLAVTAAAVGAVPLTTHTGEQLKAALPPNNPRIEEHAALGDDLLPFALAFGVAVLLLVIAGRLADRERGAAAAVAGPGAGSAVGSAVGSGGRPGAGTSDVGLADAASADADTATRVPRTWRRVAIIAAALVAFTGVAATVQTVRVGHSGSTAVWQGVGGR